MSKDPVSPILAFKHYVAMERRLQKVMKYILECLDSHKAAEVFLTVYHNPSVPMPEPGAADDEEDERKDDQQQQQQQQQQPPQESPA